MLLLKSVTLRHPKAASILLKPVTQSNIITQELETVEKPNIHNIESVTIEHQKTVTKSIKSIKQPKVIIQEPNKIKFYAESKPADHMLRLDLIKRYILPKKCSQQFEIKIVNSKKYDEQLNLARSPVKNKDPSFD